MISSCTFVSKCCVYNIYIARQWTNAYLNNAEDTLDGGAIAVCATEVHLL